MTNPMAGRIPKAWIFSLMSIGVRSWIIFASLRGFPQINIGDAGAGNNYSGGFGNVIAYNYAVDSYYTDPPASPDHWMMTS